MLEITVVWLGGTVSQCISRWERQRVASLSSPVLARGKFTVMACRRKIVSPLLEEFFYKRGYDKRATTAITMDEVEVAVMEQLEAVPAIANSATVK